MAPKTTDSLGARRGKRFALALFVAFAAVFIVSSTWQIWTQVFAEHATEATASAECSNAAHLFEDEVDLALTRAAKLHVPAYAHDKFEDSLKITGDISLVQERCSKTPPDREMLVAATRLRETAEAAAEQQAAVLARVRRAVEAHAER